MFSSFVRDVSWSQVNACACYLQETKIGITVNKLRQNANKEIADLAKEIVRKWKNDVGSSKPKTDGPMTPSSESL